MKVELEDLVSSNHIGCRSLSLCGGRYVFSLTMLWPGEPFGKLELTSCHFDVFAKCREYRYGSIGSITGNVQALLLVECSS